MYSTIRELLATSTGPLNLKLESANNSVVVITGIARLQNNKDEKAYGYFLTKRAQDFNGEITKMHAFDLDRSQWRIYEAPTLQPHWPALYQQKCGHPAFTKSLFATEEAAKSFLKGDVFIRLAKELPPIIL